MTGAVCVFGYEADLNFAALGASTIILTDPTPPLNSRRTDDAVVRVRAEKAEGKVHLR